MRRLLLLLTVVTSAGCDRFEAPGYAASQVIPAEVTEAKASDGTAVVFVRDTRPRDRGPQLAVFQGGQLRLEGGCLLLNDALIVWPREARLDLSTPGRIAVADEGGTAIVGEYLSPTGGVVPGRIDNPRLGPCAGKPLFLVNGFEPLSPAEWAEFHDADRLTRPPPPSAGDALPVQGRWVVTAINGRSATPGGEPIRVEFGRRTIAAQSQCIPWRWAVLPPPARPRTRLTNGSEPVCDRGRSDWELAFEAAMNRASAFQLRGDELIVTGEGGQLALRPDVEVGQQ